MDASAHVRNLRDVLNLYNQITESCFLRCVDDMNSRSLNNSEDDCVNRCSAKFISANHRMMSVYVEVQTALVTKKVQEAQAEQNN